MQTSVRVGLITQKNLAIGFHLLINLVLDDVSALTMRYWKNYFLILLEKLSPRTFSGFNFEGYITTDKVQLIISR